MPQRTAVLFHFRASLAAMAAVLCLAGAPPAAAHTVERGIVLLLPTPYYIAGGAITVAATFLVLLLAPGLRLARLFAPVRSLPAPPDSWRLATSMAAFLLLLFLLHAGLAGTRDPLMNPLPLMVWTVFWVTLPLGHAVVGGLWSWLNPWHAPYRLVCRLAGRDADRPVLPLPERIGCLPAVAWMFAFGWFELVDLAPDDPERLARALAFYWAATLAGMLLFGGQRWLDRGECFTVLFGFISRLAPIGRLDDREDERVVLTVPGRRAIDGPAPDMTGVLFLLLALATVAFDGLNKTFWYLDLIAVNPLEFPGRSAVMAENTVGLVAMFLAMLACYLGAVWAGGRIGGASRPLADAAPLVLSLLPISLAFHFSHYLTVALVNGQYALAAASDPLGNGADLLGLGHFHVTTSFLNDLHAVETIWNVQSGAIVSAHVWAVVLSHAIALRRCGDPRRAALSQAPMAALMVAYTVFGLWLLSTPTGL